MLSKSILADNIDSTFNYAGKKRFTVWGEHPKLDTKIDATRFSITSGAIASLFVVQHIAQSNTIWRDGSKFTITEDGAYSLFTDKTGHIISSYDACYIFGEAMLFSGLDKHDAALTGALLGWTYLNYIEVMDGFGENFGFSPTDLYFNSFGALLYYLQFRIPFLQNFTPKFTFIPANLHGEQRRENHLYWVDDYSSQTFWLSINIHNLLPKDIKQYWPKWIELSFGYTARNIAFTENQIELHRENNVQGDYYNWGESSPGFGSPRYIISLDWNLNYLISEKSPNWLNWTMQTLNHFKWPSPAIEFSHERGPKFMLVYPFPLEF